MTYKICRNIINGALVFDCVGRIEVGVVVTTDACAALPT